MVSEILFWDSGTITANPVHVNSLKIGTGLPFFLSALTSERRAVESMVQELLGSIKTALSMMTN